MKLQRDFYNRPVLTVAQDLIGKTLVHVTPVGTLKSIIVETEAYDGTCDKGCHAYPYKNTPRTSVLFGPAGHAYVYLIYGMYCCFNIVTCSAEYPAAVLIRALQPIEGTEIMANYRRQSLPLTSATYKKLCSGPGKLCQAMDITRSDNGLDMCGDTLYIEETGLEHQQLRFSSIQHKKQAADSTNLCCQQLQSPSGLSITASPRINIDYAEEAVDFLWRFTLDDSPYLSVPPGRKK